MAILVDPPAVPAYGTHWSHLISDESLEELHSFARANGLPRRGFEGDHYDVPAELYERMLAGGANPVSSRDVVQALTRSGLRFRKRKGDKPLDRVRNLVLPDGMVVDVDVIASTRPVSPSRALGTSVLVREAGGLFATLFSVRRGQWGPPGGWVEEGEQVREAAVREVGEEIGIRIAPEDLTPIGFEVMHAHDQEAWAASPAAGRDVLAAFTVQLDTHRPPIASVEAQTNQQSWVTAKEFEARCSEFFWWPLAGYHFEIGPWARPAW